MATIPLLSLTNTLKANTGATYALVPADNDKVLTFSTTTGTTVTLPNNLAAGFECEIIQIGTGQVTLAAASGATLNNRQTHTRTAGRYASIRLLVTANANGSQAVYNLTGDTAAGTTVTQPTGPVIYMATNGNDANNGSTASVPVRSLNRATALATAGTTIVVAAGTYSGAIQTINASGTSSAPITIQPADGATVIFDGSGTAANTTLININGDYITFKNITVRNSTRIGIGLWETVGCKILNCIVHTCMKAGIWTGGGTAGASNNNLTDGCEVYNCVRENVGQAMGTGGWAVALAIANSDNSITQNCYVHHCYGEGIGILETIGAKLLDNTVHDVFSIGLYVDNGQSATVQRNVYYHSHDSNYYRNNQPAHGGIIANENTSRMLPSSNINFTQNIIAGSPTQVSYSTFGANTGLINSQISPNTYYSTPEQYFASL